jgi:hypothetical protein
MHERCCAIRRIQRPSNVYDGSAAQIETMRLGDALDL